MLVYTLLVAGLLFGAQGAGPGRGRRPVVWTAAGGVRGVRADDGDYFMFLGIPYARVNASNPFGASLRPKKFKEIFEASTESPVCPQMKEVYYKNHGDFPYEGALDCLRLNVFVPDSETRDRGVYMFVFGGRFNTGHNQLNLYGPKYLVRHDIIVVTFNFRVGPYGFMCTDMPEIPGNQGVRDQYDAIEWVRDNIRAFGGDPQKITLGGHSSGAMLVDLHLLSKRPRLFQQAIVQSGVATSPHVLSPPDAKALVKIASKLGFETDDTYAALSFLAAASPGEVTRVSKNYVWGVCIEKKHEGVFPVIDENPELSAGINIDGMNILGGFTNKECLYNLYSPLYAYLFNQPNVVQLTLGHKFKLNNDSDLIDIVRHFYIEDDTDRETRIDQTVDFFSDYIFVYPVQRQLFKYSEHRNTTVYLYMFSFEGRLNRMKRLYGITEAGATHSDELGYMFTMDFLPEIPNDDEQRMIDRLTTLWSNFVKYGNPTPAASALLPLAWPALSAGSARCLHLDRDLSVTARPLHRSMAFWDLFYDGNLNKLTYGPRK